jgi:hypothetical protein
MRAAVGAVVAEVESMMDRDMGDAEFVALCAHDAARHALGIGAVGSGAEDLRLDRDPVLAALEVAAGAVARAGLRLALLRAQA